jgi:hypothetical protein
MTVQCDRSIGQVPIEDELQHATHVSHLVRRYRCFTKDVGEAGGFEQAIALAKGQVEHFAQSKYRLTAGLGPTRLYKTDMPYGEPSPTSQLELAQPARLPPGVYPPPNRCRCICHAGILFVAP